MTRFACVHVPCFAAAAAERCEPTLRDRPLAIVVGAPPATRVLEANAVARERGVAPGMTETEARARARPLVTRPPSGPDVTAARAALLDAVFAVSPRIEEAAPGVVHVDAAGLERLVGDPAAIAARLARVAAAVGLPARVGMGTTRAVARVAASLSGPRITIVPPAEEAAWLAAAPLHVLALGDDVAEMLAGWGIRTLGELAALPRDGLADRLGAAGLRAQDAARGVDREPFRPYVPPPFWEEAMGLEWEIESLIALAPILDAVLDRLCARLTVAGVAADAIGVELRLADGTRHVRAIPLAYPLREGRPLATLIALDLEAHPPTAPVTGVIVSAHPVSARATQATLGQPPTPAVRDLAAAVARLARLVGPDNFGSPVVNNSHRPDDVALVPFTPVLQPGADATATLASVPARGRARANGEVPSADAYRLALRRVRPPRRVEVSLEGGRPVAMDWSGWQRITRAAGPWRISGQWWDGGRFAREEWDVALADGTLCRLARDGITDAWLLDAVYD
jgi:protein ImuB